MRCGLPSRRDRSVHPSPLDLAPVNASASIRRRGTSEHLPPSFSPSTAGSPTATTRSTPRPTPRSSRRAPADKPQSRAPAGCPKPPLTPLPPPTAPSPQRREFCFTLEGDIFVRYQSFKDAAELHSALKDRRAGPPSLARAASRARPADPRLRRRARRVPSKIDIGPVFNVDPQKRAAYTGSGERAFAPSERELVFDVARSRPPAPPPRELRPSGCGVARVSDRVR